MIMHILVLSRGEGVLLGLQECAVILKHVSIVCTGWTHQVIRHFLRTYLYYQLAFSDFLYLKHVSHVWGLPFSLSRRRDVYCLATRTSAHLSSYNSYCKFINWHFDLYSLVFWELVSVSHRLNLINSLALMKSNSKACKSEGLTLDQCELIMVKAVCQEKP